jgi:putative GTP pyrophosphokinase
MKNADSGSIKLPERTKALALYDKHLSAHKGELQQLAQEIRLILERHGLTPTIKHRIKSFDAYYEKLRKINRTEVGKRLRPINDFFGLRVICPFIEDTEIVAGLIATHCEVLDTESKASQHSFREFGYDSVHQTIRLSTQHRGRMLPGTRKVCEIQLRTILQDAWAEVEHELVYKSDIALPNQSIRRKLASLNATLTLSDLIFQEIRDYQKELRRHGQKRRDIPIPNAHEQDDIAISYPTADADVPHIGPALPSSTASSLERTMMRALEAHSSHDLETAIALYSQMLGMQLDRKLRGLVYNHRGMAHFAMGNHQQALKDFSNAIKYDRENDRGYANRGLCYRVLKKCDLALRDFNQVIHRIPNRPDGYFGRAQTYFEMQQCELAREDCRKALSIHSGYQPARELLKRLQL